MLTPLRGLIESLSERAGVAIAIVLPDGSSLRAGDGEPPFTVVFRSDAALMPTVARDHLALLEANFGGSTRAPTSASCA